MAIFCWDSQQYEISVTRIRSDKFHHIPYTAAYASHSVYASAVYFRTDIEFYE